MAQDNELIEQIKSSAVELEEEGLNFYECIEVLRMAKSRNINGYVQFNGTKMYSLFDSEDDCYKKVYGKTKLEYEDYMSGLQKKFDDDSKTAVENFQRALPELLEKGEQLIYYPQRKKEWKDMVEFQGTLAFPELAAFEGCISVFEKLSANVNPDEVFESLKGLTEVERDNILQLVALYHKDGPELVKKYFPETKEYWGKRFEKIEAQNASFGNQPSQPQ